VNGITGEMLTYRDVDSAVHRVASGLNRLGVRHNDIVACIGPNSHEYIFALLGAMCNGAPVATVNPTYTACELAQMKLLYAIVTYTHTPTHTHPFNGAFSGTTQVSRYQKGKTNLDFTEARESEWQWQLGHMQVCTSLQTDNHASASQLSFLLQAGCPSCRPTNSVKALKAR